MSLSFKSKFVLLLVAGRNYHISSTFQTLSHLVTSGSDVRYCDLQSCSKTSVKII